MNDLDLAVELVNTVYALADPPDRLTDVEHFRAILRGGGHGPLAEQLVESDLLRLRTFREQLRTVFHAEDPTEAATLVNAMLQDASAVPQLAVGDNHRLGLSWGAAEHGARALIARLTGAVCEHLTEHGIHRLGVCAAAPCECVFVDRTRPGTRKYCCDACNDRVAAAHYRRVRH